MPLLPAAPDPRRSPHDAPADLLLLARARAHVQRTTRRVASQAALGAALAAGAATVLAGHPAGAVVATTLMLGGPLLTAIVLRYRIVNLAAAATGDRRRRMLIRWLPRLFVVVSLFGWTLAPIAGWNIPAVALTGAGLATATGAWCDRQLAREEAGTTVNTSERALLIGLLAGAAFAVLSLLATGAFVAWSIHHALSGLSSAGP